MLKRDDRLALVEKILNDQNYEGEDQRILAWKEMTGKGRTTYFRLKKEFLKKAKGKPEEVQEVVSS